METDRIAVQPEGELRTWLNMATVRRAADAEDDYQIVDGGLSLKPWPFERRLRAGLAGMWERGEVSE